MTSFICQTCGVQHAERADAPDQPPATCPVCEDERQYVNRKGQLWTTLDDLRRERRTEVSEAEPDLYAIESKPSFAIGQRAMLVRTPAGNLMWDCVSTIDDAAVARVRQLGGAKVIAVSHPHFYSSIVEWASALGATVWLHGDDRAFVMRPDPVIHHWSGETADPIPGSGLTLVRTGGHFPGMTALLWPARGGTLFCGDMPMVVPRRGWVSFMYSYPNLVPLPPAEVRAVVERLAPHRFDRMFSSWADRVVESDAKVVVARSAERYVRMAGSP